MKTRTISSLTLTLFVIFAYSSATSTDKNHDFLECLRQEFQNDPLISDVVYTPSNSSFISILRFPIKNLRFATEATPKPQAIITPQHESQIPPVIRCAKKSDVEIRTRSGGHDFEGLSSASQVPYVIIDLINLSEITVDVGEKTAWVGGGATMSTLYYRIAEKSPILGFPGGGCLTLGVGGLFSGGGYGPMLRKHGLAADNIIDARIIDVNGRILDRKSMGEDLFWAIRGGGGASFGVIVAWKVQLVDVPETVTVFAVSRTLEQNATEIIHRWQYVVPKIDHDLFMTIIVNKVNATITANFGSMFLGGVDRLISLMEESFPELGVEREDCIESSWIKSALFLMGFPIETPLEVMLNRSGPPTLAVGFFKVKSNYVQNPIPQPGLEGVWRYLNEPEMERGLIYIVPYGGRMAEISESAIPFPHRAANLYSLSHYISWEENEDRDSDRYINWTRRLYDYLTPYVSSNPREAYLNYRDLDLGVNNVQGKTSYEQASIWGKKYFNNNFDRLVRVKTKVDPHNFFRNEQSIPPLYSKWTKKGN